MSDKGIRLARPEAMPAARRAAPERGGSEPMEVREWFSARGHVPRLPLARTDASTLGNQALLRMLHRGQARARMVLSNAGDPAEREADRLAERMVVGPAACPACLAGSPCATCAPGAILQPSPNPAAHAPTGHPDVAALRSRLGTGRPLDHAQRAPFETSLGVSLGHVRVHTDERAAYSARSIGALAYTVGNDVVFAVGQYSPTTDAGRRLLAHELVHVAQNGSHAAEHGAVVQRQEADPTPADPMAEPGPLRPSTDFYVFQGVQMTGDEAYMRQEMRLLIRRSGLVGADLWIAVLRGDRRPVPLPFSAHARAFGGLRPRSALDVQREMQDEPRRSALAPVAVPLALHVYPEIRREAVEQLNRFFRTMRDTLNAVLAESQTRLDTQRVQYGLRRGANGPHTFFEAENTVAFQATIGAAADLLAVRTRINSLHARQNALTQRRGRSAAFVPEENRAAHEQLGGQIQTIEREYQQARASVVTRHPIIGAVLDDYGAGDPTEALRRLAAGERRSGGQGRFTGPPGAAAMMQLAIEQRQRGIDGVREQIADDPDKLWSLDSIVALSRAVMGTHSITMADRVIDDYMAERRLNEAFRNLFVGAIALALAIPSGGSSLLAVGAAAGSLLLSGYQLMQSLSRYQLEHAATQTDLDRAQAISTEDPSSFWLAMDVVFFVVDGVAALRAVRALRGVARAAVVAAEGAEAIETAARLERAADAVPGARPGLGRRLLESLARLRRRPAALRELGELGEAEARAVSRAGGAIAREAQGAETILEIAGHEVKVTRGGHLVVCTSCTWLRERYARELAENADLLRRVSLAEQKAAANAIDTTAKAEIARLTRELEAALQSRLLAEVSPQAAQAARQTAGGPTGLPRELAEAADLAPRATSPDGAVRAGESVPYRDSTARGRGVVGDRLTGDHIPSRAALVQAHQEARYAAEAARLQRPLTAAERQALRLTRAETDAIRDQALTIVKGEDLHAAASRTFAGRNTADQIAQDARDLAIAVELDFVADLSHLEGAGTLTREGVGVYIQHYNNLVARQVIGYSDRIHQVLLEYLRRAR